MGLTINNIYVLTWAELMVLAAAKGIENLFGLGDPRSRSGEEQVIDAVHHLYQQGILNNNGEDGFVLHSDMDEILKTISGASVILLFRDYMREQPVLKVLYAGCGYVVMEQAFAGREIFRLYGILPEELQDLLEDGSGEKELPYRYMLDEDNVINRWMVKKEVLKPDEIAQLGNVLQMFEFVIPGTEQVWKRIAWMRSRESGKLLCSEEGRVPYEIPGVEAPLNYVAERFMEVEGNGFG